MVPCYISKYHGIATEYYCICPSSELYEQYESMIPVHRQHGSLFQTCDHISRHAVLLTHWSCQADTVPLYYLLKCLLSELNKMFMGAQIHPGEKTLNEDLSN